MDNWQRIDNSVRQDPPKTNWGVKVGRFIGSVIMFFFGIFIGIAKAMWSFFESQGSEKKKTRYKKYKKYKKYPRYKKWKK